MIRTSNASLVFLALSLAFATPGFTQSKSTRENSLASSPKSNNSPATDTPVQPATTSSEANSPGTEKSDADKREADKRAEKVARENAQKHYKAGLKYGRANLHRQAAQYFEQAIAADPNFTDAYYALGHANLTLGRYSEAIAAFEKFVKLAPENTDAYTLIGQAYVKLKEQKQSSPNPITTMTQVPGVFTGQMPVRSEGNLTNATTDPTQLYRVGGGDVLDIRVPGSVTEASTLYTVSSSGKVDHPLLGDAVKVTGLTTKEISDLIGGELKRRAIAPRGNPEVAVRDYNSHTILVSGLVKEPGIKILRREAIPLYVVLADAQPLPEAGLVTVRMQEAAKNTSVELAEAQQTSMLVHPGDVVTVQPALTQFFYIGGEVKSPGEHPFRRGLSLTQAILTAGGLTPRGEKVQLMRSSADGLLSQQEFKLKEINKGKIPDPIIQPGDRITVLQ